MLTFIKKYKRAIIIMLIALLLSFAAFVAFAVYSLRNVFESDTSTPTASQYSEWVGIWLPQDVQHFQAYGEGWQDWLVEAKFEMSAAQLPEFLERNKLQPSDLEGDLESSYKLEWFSAKSTLEQYEVKPSPESAGSTTSTGFYPAIWVDDANSDKVTIYIKAFDT